MAESTREKRLAPRVYAYRRDESQKMLTLYWPGPQLQQMCKSEKRRPLPRGNQLARPYKLNPIPVSYR